jgi:hypothetical protein
VAADIGDDMNNDDVKGVGVPSNPVNTAHKNFARQIWLGFFSPFIRTTISEQKTYPIFLSIYHNYNIKSDAIAQVFFQHHIKTTYYMYVFI